MNVDYNLYRKKNILGILEEGEADLATLSKRCHSVFPNELKRLLEEMTRDNLIVKKNGLFFHKKKLSIPKRTIYRKWEENRKKADAGLLKLKKNLHLPHCLDYEWWFSVDSLEEILKNLLNNHPFELPDNIAFLGAPILASYISYFLPKTKIIILDKSLPTLKHIEENISNNNILTVHYNAEHKMPEELIGSSDMVFFDPPWYPEYYNLFIKRAQQLTYGHYSTISMAVFPAFTRPSSLNERKQLIVNAINLGLDPIKLEPDILSYEIPFFEEETLKQNKISPVNWRKGDMIIFLNNGKCLPKNGNCQIETEYWNDFLIGKIKVKVKKNPEETTYIPPCILTKNPSTAVLNSVSKRSPVRKNIDLWTSTHIGLKIKGWETISLILDGMSKGQNFEEITKKIQLSFQDISIDKIKSDSTKVYKILKELLT